jgi:hypothetical protein
MMIFNSYGVNRLCRFNIDIVNVVQKEEYGVNRLCRFCIDTDNALQKDFLNGRRL